MCEMWEPTRAVLSHGSPEVGLSWHLGTLSLESRAYLTLPPYRGTSLIRNRHSPGTTIRPWSTRRKSPSELRVFPELVWSNSSNK